MFRTKTPEYQLLLEGEIVQQLKVLRSQTTGTDEFEKALRSVERLHDMIGKPSSPVSKDTLASVGANLLGIIMIIKHESLNVITSKAMSFVIRPRI